MFGSEEYVAICNRIRYLISLKSGITYIFSDCSTKIKSDSYDSLPTEKRLTLHDVIINIKSVLNKDSQKGRKKDRKTEIAKENFYATRKPLNICDVNIDKIVIVISKLVEAKINSKYLIGYLDKDIKPLALIMPKMSWYVKTFKDEEKIN